MRAERPSDAFSFPVVTLNPFKGSGTELEKNLTLSSESCSLAIDRNAALEIWSVLRDLQGEPEVLRCPAVFRNSSQGGCAQERGGWPPELENGSG